MIKALGLSSGEMSGEDLMAKVSSDLLPSELIDTLKSLMAQGYVDCDRSSFYSIEEFKPLFFRVNSGYAKDLREALDPQSQRQQRSRRIRRE